MGKIKNILAARTLKNEFASRRTKLYRIAFSWCHSASQADDLVQEALFKAMKNIDSLRDHSIIDAWLYRIMLNCWHDYLRVKGRNVESVEIKDESTTEHSEAYQQGQIVSRVRKSVAGLPMTLREVVTLVDFAGMSYAEVAEIVDIPIGTVMSRLFRARKNLKQELMDLSLDENTHLKLRRIK